MKINSCIVFSVTFSFLIALLIIWRKELSLFAFIDISFWKFGATMLGISMLMLALVPSIIVAIPIIFLVGVSSILYMTATTTMIQVEAKQEMHGRLTGLQSVFLIGTGVIGGPLSGWVADAMGARVPIIFGGIACLFAALFSYIAMWYFNRANAKVLNPAE